MTTKIYPSKAELSKKFSKWFADFIAATPGDVNIALSGGSTPKMIFEELATTFKDEIDWSGVHFYWGDERCVPPTDMDSNFGMTAELLLSRITIPSENIHRIKGENPPEEEALNYGMLLANQLPMNRGLPGFDLVILGMGDDGHTASIFPHQIALWEAESNCVVATHPESGQKRISLTGNVINNAGTVVFLVSGAAKAEKVLEIHKSKGNYSNYPASLVAPVSGQLYWFLDQDAARKL